MVRSEMLRMILVWIFIQTVNPLQATIHEDKFVLQKIAKGVGTHQLLHHGILSLDSLHNAFSHKALPITKTQIHMGCVNYNRTSEWKSILMKMIHNISFFTSYNSNNDNLHCDYLFMESTPVADLQDTVNRTSIEYHFVKPLPNLLKLDQSVIGYLLYSNYDAYENDLNITSFKYDLLYHPSVQKLLNVKRDDETIHQKVAVQMKIIFRRDIPKFKLKNLIEQWKVHLKSSITSAESFNEIFWTNECIWFHHDHCPSSSQSFHVMDSMTDIRLRHHHEEKFRTDSINSTVIQHYMHKHWKLWQTTFNGWIASNAVKKTCKYDDINWNLDKFTATILLPDELLKSNDSNTDNPTENINLVSSVCLSYLLSVLIQDSHVLKISLSTGRHLLNNYARTIVQSGLSAKGGANEPYSAIGLDGTGVIVGISDTGIDQNSCYFHDAVHGPAPISNIYDIKFNLEFRKIVQYVNYSGSIGDYGNGHGSHTTGSIAGYCVDYDATTNAQHNVYRGAASGAKLAFFDIGVNDAGHDLSIPFDLSSQMFALAYAAGARIYSNSWGGGFLYDEFCIEVDEYLYQNPDFLAIFAAGNDGGSRYEVVLSPALAKNAIAVAASETEHFYNQNIGNVAGFSAAGPSPDGRIKPDITTPGSSIMSVAAQDENSDGNSCATEFKEGTSMAAPIAAGHAALIMQYFQNESFWAQTCISTYRLCDMGTFSPSGSFLKALILHSGQPMSSYNGGSLRTTLNNPPDIFEGYGRLDLSNILPIPMGSDPTHKGMTTSPFTLFVEEFSLQALTEKVFYVEITNNLEALRVTISWYDPPNEVFAGRILLHDLDLLLLTPNNQVLFGNSLNRLGNPLFGAHRDEVNNNEQITVNAPMLGIWTVRVQAKRLTESVYQNCSIVITAPPVYSNISETKSLPVVFTDPVLYSIPPILLDKCSFSTHSAMVLYSLEISLWSKVVANRGWNDGDHYTIVAAGVNNTPIIYTGDFLEPYAFETNELCMAPKCYTISLNFESKQPIAGTMLTLAQCGVHLAPMLQSGTFCVSNPVPFEQSHSNVSTYYDDVLVYPEDACQSACSLSDHILIPVNLYDEDGVGWSGGYYTIFDMEPYRSKNINDHAVTGGSLEWGFEAKRQICLPKKKKCYSLQLSYSTEAEEYPIIQWLESFLIDESGVVMNTSCPYNTSPNITRAVICTTDEPNQMSYITFYRQPNLPDNFGQVPISWNDYLLQQSSSKVVRIGSCSLNAPYDSLINCTSCTLWNDVPTMAPTTGNDDYFDRPLPLPINIPYHHINNPNQSDVYVVDPVYAHRNIDCFLSCPAYPGHTLFVSDLTEACDFLVKVFYLCDSYSIASGLCPIQNCVKSCSVNDWCYFAAGMVMTCPYQPQWNGETSHAQSINKACVGSMSAVVEVQTTPQSSSSIKMIIIGLGIFLVVLLLVGVGQYLRSSGSLNHFMSTVFISTKKKPSGRGITVSFSDSSLHDASQISISTPSPLNQGAMDEEFQKANRSRNFSNIIQNSDMMEEDKEDNDQSNYKRIDNNNNNRRGLVQGILSQARTKLFRSSLVNVGYEMVPTDQSQRNRSEAQNPLFIIEEDVEDEEDEEDHQDVEELHDQPAHMGINLTPQKDSSRG